MSSFREPQLFEYSDEALRELAQPRRMFFSPDTDAGDIAARIAEDNERVQRARAQLRRREVQQLRMNDVAFAYRLGDRANEVVFWRAGNNFSEPHVPMATIARAAAQIRKETGRKRALFSAAPAPEYFDSAVDPDRITQFNVRVVRALTALGIDAGEPAGVFYGAGMPNEWRGAMWNAAALAERVTPRSKWQADLSQRIATVCRFTRMSMAIDGLFPWVLAIGSAVLLEAVTAFHE